MIKLRRRMVVAGALFALAGCDTMDPLTREGEVGAGGGTETSGPASLAEVGETAFLTARKDLESAAASLGVDVLSEHMSYVQLEDALLVHAPVFGYEKYTNDDFAKGVPLTVVLARAEGKLGLPDGDYLVKAQVASADGAPARTGKAMFFDASGKVALERELYVRYPKELNEVFPGASDEGPLAIPHVTSTHVWRWDFVLKKYRWFLDCSGWTPFRTVYY